MWDQHMHCMFSGDSDADPVLMIKSAINKGLDGICFTDHLDYDYKEEPGLFDLDIAAYEKRIKRLAIALKEKGCPVNIHWGIEIGLQPHITDKNNEVTKKYPFDLVIGSSHVVNGIDPYYPVFYKGKTEHEAYTEYFESILDNLHSGADFDVYGHIDYVVRYGPDKNKYYSYEKYADIIDAILKEIISQGKGIELNTAGFKYGLGHPNPTEDVLK
nr:histidinol-phosphatase HisJ family protein [Agathobacter sp.]